MERTVASLIWITDRRSGQWHAVMGNDQHRIAVFPTGVLQKLQHLFACFKNPAHRLVHRIIAIRVFG